MELVPITRDQAGAFVAEHHRHNGPPIGWLFGVGLQRGGELVAVAMAGRPSARMLDDGRTLEITRLCTLGDRNAASRLYGALCRAGAALGYRRAITYTLQSEPGSSLRGAGFGDPAPVEQRETWARPSRGRYERNIWGEPVLPPEPRIRWQRVLA